MHYTRTLQRSLAMSLLVEADQADEWSTSKLLSAGDAKRWQDRSLELRDEAVRLFQFSN